MRLRTVVARVMCGRVSRGRMRELHRAENEGHVMGVLADTRFWAGALGILEQAILGASPRFFPMAK